MVGYGLQPPDSFRRVNHLLHFLEDTYVILCSEKSVYNKQDIRFIRLRESPNTFVPYNFALRTQSGAGSGTAAVTWEDMSDLNEIPKGDYILQRAVNREALLRCKYSVSESLFVNGMTESKRLVSLDMTWIILLCMRTSESFRGGFLFWLFIVNNFPGPFFPNPDVPGVVTHVDFLIEQ